MISSENQTKRNWGGGGVLNEFHPTFYVPQKTKRIHTPKALHIRFITAKQKYYLLKVPFINLTLKATELYDGIMQIRDV